MIKQTGKYTIVGEPIVTMKAGRVVFSNGTHTTWDFINPESAIDKAFKTKGKAEIKEVEIAEPIAIRYMEQRERA